MAQADIDAAELIALARELVRRPSEQTALFEADPAVTAFVRETVAPRLERQGLLPRFDAMGNLLVEVAGGTPGPDLAFVGYAMTHPAGGMATPFAGEYLEDTAGARLRGRGIAEQKASLAAAMAAVETAARAPLAGRLRLFVLTAGETGRHDAMASALDMVDRAPDHAVVLVGTGGAVALGNKGRIDVEVTVRGAPCHSSQPWRGVDAIAGARAVLDRLDAVALGGEHPGLGRPSLVATRIRSWPEATHTLQDRVELTLDRRLLPDDDPDAALAAVADAAALDPPWAVEVRRGPFMHACALPADGRLLAAIDAGCRAAALAPPPRFWSHGALDAGYLARAGAEATMWGPGDPQLWHQPDETVAVDALVDGARAYLALIRHLLRPRP